MNRKETKLKMKINGRFQYLWVNLVLKRKARSLGLKITNSCNYNRSFGELEVDGSKNNLWKFIASLRKPSPIVRLEKITFHFVD